VSADIRSHNGEDGTAPVRLVHLGLGSFFRAHQAWYTAHADDAADWPIAAFTGRRPDLADALDAQDGRYTLVTRAADGDRFEVIDRIARAHPADDLPAWLAYLASPDVAVLTVTVTEAAYLAGPGGGADVDNRDLLADVEALGADPSAAVSTVPGRIVAGLLARRAAEAGPIAVVPCDNLPDNGRVIEAVVTDVASLVDPTLAGWIARTVAFVTTMVDRITPATTDEDVRTVAAATGWSDRAPVVTEPFSEWVLAGSFPSGRPRWETAGATFTDDIEPFEQRKLWLLNGAHSLLAYAGASRGHETVAQAAADPICREWMAQWWDEAAAHLALPSDALDRYRSALVARFTNPRMRHRLDQIAADGSQKLPVRVLPVLRRERAAGRLPVGATRILAGWLWHLREHGAQVVDVAADRVAELARGPLDEAVPRVVGALDADLRTDAEVLRAVHDHTVALGAR
jgi:fructuronate reductase